MMRRRGSHARRLRPYTLAIGVLVVSACSGTSHEAREPTDPSPPALLALDGFSIERTEVTVARYRACAEAGACTADGLDFHAACHWAREGYDEQPINCLDWHQARAYCAWAGMRLPTNAE